MTVCHKSIVGWKEPEKGEKMDEKFSRASWLQFLHLKTFWFYLFFVYFPVDFRLLFLFLTPGLFCVCVFVCVWYIIILSRSTLDPFKVATCVYPYISIYTHKDRIWPPFKAQFRGRGGFKPVLLAIRLPRGVALIHWLCDLHSSRLHFAFHPYRQILFFYAFFLFLKLVCVCVWVPVFNDHTPKPPQVCKWSIICRFSCVGWLWKV